MGTISAVSELDFDVPECSVSLRNTANCNLQRRYRAMDAHSFVDQDSREMFDQWYQNDNVDWEFKLWIAEQDFIPLDLVITLANDDNPVVRAAIAQNESCTVTILKDMLSDEDKRVRNAARLALWRAWKSASTAA